MPEIIPLGWFHIVMGVIALVSGGFTLVRFKEISLQTRSGQIYLATTLITAGTALAIFQHGEFGPGHALAVMTLLALAVGTVAATMKPFGKLSRHVQAISYSATLLFHSVPAVTDGLLRLPAGDPVFDVDRRSDSENMLPGTVDPFPGRCQLAIALDSSTAHYR